MTLPCPENIIMKSNLARASSLDIYRLPPLTTRERIDAVRYEESLGDFIKAAWPHAGEPQKFDSNWHIDCLADHLMAVARREIKGPGPLIFTLPPRHMKSRGVNVFFPAWAWAQDADPDQTGHGLMRQVCLHQLQAATVQRAQRRLPFPGPQRLVPAILGRSLPA